MSVTLIRNSEWEIVAEKMAIELFSVNKICPIYRQMETININVI